MRIVFAGTPEVAVPSLTALAASDHEVVAVLTREDAPVGRKRQLTPSPVAVAARELGLPVITANRLTDAVRDQIAALRPDLGVIVAYGGLLREPLLSDPAHGWINLHFSALPRWRGAAPVQRALMDGETDLGLTVFRLVAELDAGPVLARDTLPVAPGTTAGEALAALATAGTATLLRAIAAAPAEPGEPQTGAATHAPKLSRADGKLDPAEPAARVLARFAGVTPEPGAYVETAAGPLKVRELRLADPAAEPPITDADPGTVELRAGRAWLRAGDDWMLLGTVQPAGKPAMDAAAWLRGRGGRTVCQ